MQQAARISDNTAFFLLGEIVEYGATEKASLAFRGTNAQKITSPGGLVNAYYV